jgi:hypothetical protein
MEVLRLITLTTQIQTCTSQIQVNFFFKSPIPEPDSHLAAQDTKFAGSFPCLRKYATEPCSLTPIHCLIPYFFKILSQPTFLALKNKRRLISSPYCVSSLFFSFPMPSMSYDEGL